ncbi:MAG TPA: N-acetylmuramoyl-L-alanine amidase [Caulobacteraceae bacterium]|nr:N-acetylmuramoyl-L-alanine amidase [Caulobacteraceae bacterium]
MGRWGALSSKALRVLLGAGFALACAAAVAATSGLAPAIGLEGVRFGGDAHQTRMVLDLEQGASAKVPEGDAEGRTLVLDFRALKGEGRLEGPGSGLVRRWTLEAVRGGARLSLDLAAQGRIRRRFLLPPADGVDHYRYVIDVEASDAVAPAAEAPVTAAFQDPLAPSRAWHVRKVVVIDAGHGGQDPGAQGAEAVEKNVTLAAAKVLAARLEDEGRYKVVLTRDSDVFVPLSERVQIARKSGADLFISLHADSGENPQTHGATVYTLSDQGTTRVSQVLSGHEWFSRAAARSADPAVGKILLDLSQRSTRNESAEFADVLLSRIADRNVDLLPRSHRDANYFVLLAPDVPAVLLEMGFITNPEDEARLTDPRARRRMMDAVADAIDAYFDGEMRLASR